MSGVTGLDSLASLPHLLQDLCIMGKPLEQPEPHYDAIADCILAHVQPVFGTTHAVTLPVTAVSLSRLGSVAQSFKLRMIAVMILDGTLFPRLKAFVPHLVSKPSLVINK